MEPLAGPGDQRSSGPARIQEELVLCFYDRIPLDGLETTGDAEPMEQLAEWDPNA
ncbi:hypothetical protein [Kitasatospora herbaricolor]|uniref:Uncharacterized protein n=1 Tax=Kitasatospora herbaricolor TaxID=68217 RepID=A0ABZ1WM35_9ACTN|nr:hypothetical protein [Kitasatospora herbaricolor]